MQDTANWCAIYFGRVSMHSLHGVGHWGCKAFFSALCTTQDNHWPRNVTTGLEEPINITTDRKHNHRLRRTPKTEPPPPEP